MFRNAAYRPVAGRRGTEGEERDSSWNLSVGEPRSMAYRNDLIANDRAQGWLVTFAWRETVRFKAVHRWIEGCRDASSSSRSRKIRLTHIYVFRSEQTVASLWQFLFLGGWFEKSDLPGKFCRIACIGYYILDASYVSTYFGYFYIFNFVICARKSSGEHWRLWPAFFYYRSVLFRISIVRFTISYGWNNIVNDFECICWKFWISIAEIMV